MVHVPDVQGELLLPREGIATAGQHRSGHARRHLVAAPLLRRVEVAVLHQQRPGTHQAHLTLEHVDQFRQFIQGEAAQEAAQPGEALLVGEQVALLVPVVGHGTELVDDKRLSPVAQAGLAEEDGPPHGQPSQKGDEKE